MPRTARIAPGGMVFHVLNLGIAWMQIFEKTGDYEAFERTVRETLEDAPMRICAYCVLPNHWHFLLWPEHDGDLARFMHRLTITHVRCWQQHRHYERLAASHRITPWPGVGLPACRPSRYRPKSDVFYGMKKVSCPNRQDAYCL